MDENDRCRSLSSRGLGPRLSLGETLCLSGRRSASVGHTPAVVCKLWSHSQVSGSLSLHTEHSKVPYGTLRLWLTVNAKTRREYFIRYRVGLRSPGGPGKAVEATMHQCLIARTPHAVPRHEPGPSGGPGKTRRKWPCLPRSNARLDRRHGAPETMPLAHAGSGSSAPSDQIARG